MNLSKNEIEDVSILAKLPHALSLNCSENAIANIDFLSEKDRFEFLQIANFSQNKIAALPEISAPGLKHLNVQKNEIKSCEKFTGHDRLEALELRGN